MNKMFDLSLEDIRETVEGNKIYFLKGHKIKEHVDLTIKHKNKWKSFLEEMSAIYEHLSYEVIHLNYSSNQEYLDTLQGKFSVEHFKRLVDIQYEEQFKDWVKM